MKFFNKLLRATLLSTTLILGASSVFANPIPTTITDVTPVTEDLTVTFYDSDGNELSTVPLVKLDYIQELEDSGIDTLGSSLPTKYHNLYNSDYETGFSLNGSTRIDYASRYFSPNSSDKIRAKCPETGYSDTLNAVSWNTYRFNPNTNTSTYLGSVDFSWVPNTGNAIEFYGVLNNCNPDSFYTFSISKEGYVGNVFGDYIVYH
ncbi:MAG: hypothetical protein ACRC3Y_05115 [Romboutsia sp.]|uniref:hypothetical protein n=1 Tax=Romboutsia sp. TaxID=1965302 RepID=UPI003F3B7B1A